MKKIFMALIAVAAVAAIAFTSCEGDSWTDVLTSVHQGYPLDYQGVYMWSVVAPVFTEEIQTAQGGELAAETSVVMRQQKNTDKAEKAALKASDKAAEEVIGKKFVYKESGLFEQKEYELTVAKANGADDANLAVEISVRAAGEQNAKVIATYYFKAVE